MPHSPRPRPGPGRPASTGTAASLTVIPACRQGWGGGGALAGYDRGLTMGPVASPNPTPRLAWVRVSFSRSRRKLSEGGPAPCGPGSGLTPVALHCPAGKHGLWLPGLAQTVLPRGPHDVCRAATLAGGAQWSGPFLARPLDSGSSAPASYPLPSPAQGFIHPSRRVVEGHPDGLLSSHPQCHLLTTDFLIPVLLCSGC